MLLHLTRRFVAILFHRLPLFGSFGRIKVTTGSSSGHFIHLESGFLAFHSFPAGGFFHRLAKMISSKVSCASNIWNRFILLSSEVSSSFFPIFFLSHFPLSFSQLIARGTGNKSIFKYIQLLWQNFASKCDFAYLYDFQLSRTNHIDSFNSTVNHIDSFNSTVDLVGVLPSVYSSFITSNLDMGY